MPATAMAGDRIVTATSSADTATEMAAAGMAVTRAITATARKLQATATKAATRARMASRPPPGRKPRRGSQTASEMLHSSSVRTSPAATPAIGRKAEAGGNWMAKEELLEFDGTVTEVLPDGNFRVKLDNEHEVLAYTAGKMRKFRIRTGVGDRVIVEMSPYDLQRGRISFRHKGDAPTPGPQQRRRNSRSLKAKNRGGENPACRDRRPGTRRSISFAAGAVVYRHATFSLM